MRKIMINELIFSVSKLKSLLIHMNSFQDLGFFIYFYEVRM